MTNYADLDSTNCLKEVRNYIQTWIPQAILNTIISPTTTQACLRFMQFLSWTCSPEF